MLLRESVLKNYNTLMINAKNEDTEYVVSVSYLHSAVIQNSDVVLWFCIQSDIQCLKPIQRDSVLITKS